MTIVNLHSSHRYPYSAWFRLAGITALVASMTACNTIPAAQKTPVVARPNISTSDSYPLLAQQDMLNQVAKQHCAGKIFIPMTN